MISIGPKYIKLRTALQLARSRLKIFQAKKAELAEKTRRDVANLLKKRKYMLAKIKAQRIIRDETTVEAMELIEMFCDQILAQYEMFQEMQKIDENLVEAISSLIWVAPYFQAEVAELKDIAKQLTIKYGINYSRATLKNEFGTVSFQLIKRVRQVFPSDDHIQRCLEEVSCKYDVPFDNECFQTADPNLSLDTKQVENKLESSDIKSELKEHGACPATMPLSCKTVFNSFKFKPKAAKSSFTELDEKANLNYLSSNAMGQGNSSLQQKTCNIGSNDTLHDEINVTHEGNTFGYNPQPSLFSEKNKLEVSKKAILRNSNIAQTNYQTFTGSYPKMDIGGINKSEPVCDPKIQAFEMKQLECYKCRKRELADLEYDEPPPSYSTIIEQDQDVYTRNGAKENLDKRYPSLFYVPLCPSCPREEDQFSDERGLFQTLRIGEESETNRNFNSNDIIDIIPEQNNVKIHAPNPPSKSCKMNNKSV